jgi:hypothetical protein
MTAVLLFMIDAATKGPLNLNAKERQALEAAEGKGHWTCVSWAGRLGTCTFLSWSV